MISKTMRNILHALSYGNIEVGVFQAAGGYKKTGCYPDFFKDGG